MEGQSQVQIHIPQQLVDDMVRAEIVNALGKQETFVRAMVQRAIEAKSNHYSNSPTILEEAFGEMVRAEAKKIFAEWIEQNRALLQKHFIQALTDKKNERLRKMAEGLISSIADFHIRVDLVQNRE